MLPDDVLANVAARTLLLDLDTRGIHLCVQHGNLATRMPGALMEGDRQALRRHKPDLLVLVLICEDRTLDRLLALRSGALGRERAATGCYLCGDALPDGRPLGRCGWCAVACRLHAGGPVPRGVISLFPLSIRGALPVPLSGLPFDMTVPA
jgi:hypothetical protein